MHFVIGQVVTIPCTVESVDVPGETLVTIDLPGERRSGFVRSDLVRGATVRAIVVSVAGSSVTLALPGSFFLRATNQASVPAGWAAAHLRTFPAPLLRHS